MKMVLIPCIDIVYKWICKFFSLWIMKFINESVYWHGTDRIPNCLNRLLHEVMGYVAAIIFFLSDTLPTVGRVTPQKNYSVFYNRMKVLNKELGHAFLWVLWFLSLPLSFHQHTILIILHLPPALYNLSSY